MLMWHITSEKAQGEAQAAQEGLVEAVELRQGDADARSIEPLQELTFLQTSHNRSSSMSSSSSGRGCCAACST